MSKFNPDFWEVTLSQESWQQFSTEDHLYYQEPGEEEARRTRQARAEAVYAEVLALADGLLTPRQREVVTLHFCDGLNQRQIGERLGISQQAVCEHLYGKMRDCHLVGGALRKLRRACAERGVRWG